MSLLLPLLDPTDYKEILPAHLLMLRWLIHRRILLTTRENLLLTDILAEWEEWGAKTASKVQINTLMKIYEKANKMKKEFGV